MTETISIPIQERQLQEEQHQLYQWGGWWYLERRTRPAKGQAWGDWEHVASHPHMSWLTTHYQKEVENAEASRGG